eukprot:TRINITY_DN32373_c0_g1_i1.p1 TRINITY_DN32373_c0_g1~~TRINITY_DN32373_c0_g1_i1.p1  ORF type:complete len:258 (+),score=25.46 TRINITY_DN32373_c0_g1_i1:103-876(+)
MEDLQVYRFAGLVAAECALLAFLERSSSFLSNFQARKLCHAGTGLMLLQLDSRVQLTRYFVYIFGISALAMTWQVHPKLRPFRFGRQHDVGMTAYMFVAMIWFAFELPVHVLAPMFFADPMGAVVGRYLSGLKDKGIVNPVWWRGGGTQKTLGGSAAVLTFTMVTFAGPATFLQRLLVGIAAVLAEAIGGAYDNLFLVIVVVGSRMLFNFLDFGSPSLECARPACTGELAPMMPAFQTLLQSSTWSSASSQAFLGPY